MKILPPPRQCVISLALLCISVLNFTCTFAQEQDVKFPRNSIFEVIPYLNYNNRTGPYLAGQFFSDHRVYSASIGASYQDLFGYNKWNGGDVNGINLFILKAEFNAFLIKKMDGTDSRLKASGWRIGGSHISSFFNKEFNVADTAMQHAGLNPNESYLYYPTKYVNTNYSNTMVHLGYGSQHAYWWIDHSTEKLRGTLREMYADVFITAPFLVSYSHVNQDGSKFTGVGEPAFKTLIGGRVGIQWTALRPSGFVFGMETGLRPGICHADARYGPGTNVGAIVNYYFAAKMGITIASGTNVTGYNKSYGY